MLIIPAFNVVVANYPHIIYVHTYITYIHGKCRGYILRVYTYTYNMHMNTYTFRHI